MRIRLEKELAEQLYADLHLDGGNDLSLWAYLFGRYGDLSLMLAFIGEALKGQEI